ncbi:MAG: ComF family protein [Thiohalocapsa sp.]|jgi:ComF family protein
MILRPVSATTLQALLRAGADCLFPPTCVLCGADGEAGLDLCGGCLNDLPRIDPCCRRCALPFPTEPAGATGRHDLCGRCTRHPPPFERCRAAYRYADPLPTLVAAIKFHGRMNQVRLLGALLADRLRSSGADLPDVIVPVPLHRQRLRRRGYNQSLELARVVGRSLRVPVANGWCERTRATAPQAELDQPARLKNLRGAFRATDAARDRHVAVLDDVVTTGSTVAEVARALRRVGCRRIDVWAVARTAAT